jgi:peptidyl-prolyl cis-trans isomerase SurA
MRNRIGFGIVLLAVTLVACNRGGTGSAGGGDAAASVNGKPIPRAEVENHFKIRTQDMNPKPAGDAASVIKLEILRQLIETQIIAQKAEELNIKPTDAEVDAQFKALKGNVTDEDFKKTLTDRGISELDLRREISQSLTMEKVMENQVGSRAVVSDAEISKFWEENKAAFDIKEPMYRIGVIAVTGDPNAPVNNLRNHKAMTEEEAIRKIQMIETRARAGENFQQLAQEYSEDPQTAQLGGDLGYQPAATLERFGAQFRDTILKMQPGDMTPVVRADTSYWLFKLLGKREPGLYDLTNPEVKQSIKDELQGRKQQVLMAAFSEELHNQARIENYLAQEVLASFPAK